ncbi:MAG TPA: asparagine synthase (glutamine-hydrolyzing) [Gammaproteobacteria bacterium]
MCGIAGLLLKTADARVEPELLVRMRDTMVHRGPDEEGVYTDGPLGLCHRRLSIIGVTTGRQPLHGSDARYWIVFNGEIYNYRDLRRELEQRGYRFHTESDTEVIVNAYAEYGADCVQRLNGMFAFAIWDTQTRSLFLARDRLGVKPLYYHDGPNGFVFASEIKAILSSGQVKATLDTDRVWEYFLYRGVTGENTLFGGIRSLLPGHWMRMTADSCEIRQFWTHRRAEFPVPCTLDGSMARFEELLVDAVRIRLMSEVPLGTFCSGGVDSSLVTAIAARQLGEGVNTFSVGFSDAAYDETHFARIVAQRYGTHHHELVVENADFAANLEELVWLNDEPLHFANSVQIYAISKLAKQFVTVVLTGEGADELFLGYPRYQIPQILNRVRHLSPVLRPLLGALGGMTGDHRIRKLEYFLRRDVDSAILANSAPNEREGVDALLSPGVARSAAYREAVLTRYRDLPDIGARLSFQDQHTYLVSILNRQDKMSMGASIEARVPFLDYRIAEFANALPSHCRTRWLRSKELVKRVARNYLPDEVVYRRKSGFGVPLGAWLRDDNGLGGLAERVFGAGAGAGILDEQRLRELWREHRAGTKDHSELLWTSLNFLIWRERFAVQA